MPNTHSTLTSLFDDIADEIRRQSGDDGTIVADTFPAEIKALPLAEKDCNFYDYDGTLLYAYTAETAMALTELPPGPSHPDMGITFHGWNWDLADILASGGVADIGAIYEDLGVAKFWIHVAENTDKRVMVACSPAASTNTECNATIDFGDGSGPQTMTVAVTDPYFLHQYAQAGDYVVTVYSIGFPVESTDIITLNTIMYGTSLRLDLVSVYMRTNNMRQSNSNVYANALILPHNDSPIADNVAAVGESRICFVAFPVGYENVAMGSSYSLERVSLPGHGHYDNISFSYCERLNRLVFSKNMTATLATYVFRYCYSLETIEVPEGATSFPIYCFRDDHCLRKVVSPSSLETISGSAATSLTGRNDTIEWHFKSLTPPELAKSSIFNCGAPTPNGAGIDQHSCLIFVPPGTLNDYKNATNWSTYADQIFEENET